jgi:hypothetical protein
MGYTTTFGNGFKLDRPLEKDHCEYLKAFAHIRHMKRDESINRCYDRARLDCGLPIGVDGGYYVGGDEVSYVDDYNQPPADQPGLWCQWTPNKEGTEIIWDGNEKFYKYVEWLEYLIQHFLQPWGYVLGGVVSYRGGDHDDCGIITVWDNEVTKTSIL